MKNKEMQDTIQKLFSGYRGILAMDESNPTCNKRFAENGIPQTEEKRRAYRELILTTAGLEDCINGVILYDETIRQKAEDGSPLIKLALEKGITPGIKVDMGAKKLAGHPEEKVTEGLDGLRERLQEYYSLGARFAKWRAVINIGKNSPSQTSLEVNAHALARYAALCQEEGLVPIVEPEVLMTGDHDLETCFDVTQRMHKAVFNQLFIQDVSLEAMILKPNMVLSALNCATQVSIGDVADATVKCLLRSTPAAVPGIAFLSGGQSDELATKRLNEMILKYGQHLPWALSFSFARAIQQKAMKIWKGDDKNRPEAQKALYYRAWCNVMARQGKYDDAILR